jgi:hypothetical protein
VGEWLRQAERGEWDALVGGLLTEHYDTAYGERTLTSRSSSRSSSRSKGGEEAGAGAEMAAAAAEAAEEEEGAEEVEELVLHPSEISCEEYDRIAAVLLRRFDDGPAHAHSSTAQQTDSAGQR